MITIIINRKYVISLISILAMLLSSFVFINNFFSINEKTIAAKFRESKTDIERIAAFLLQHNSESIYIADTEVYGLDGINDHEEVAYISSFIEKANLLYIEKYQHSVFFCYKAHMGNGLGVAYTYNEKKPKTKFGEIVFIKEIENNWFYCEID